jgi:hypothetical protein
MELIIKNSITLKEEISKHSTGSVNYLSKESKMSVLASWKRKSEQKLFLNYEKSNVINYLSMPLSLFFDCRYHLCCQ